MPSWLTIRDTDSALPISVPVSPGTPPLTIFQPYSSVNGADQGFGTPFEMRSLIFQDDVDGTAAANFTVMLKEVGEAREFMNNPVHIRTIAGSGQFPAILREPYMFLSQHNVSAKFVKVAGPTTQMRFYAAGAQYYPWSPTLIQYPADKRELLKLLSQWMNRRKSVTPFWLTTDNVPQDGLTPPGSVTIPAGAGTGKFQTTAKIGDDGHFEAYGWCAVSTGKFALDLVETKTKQTLMNGQVSNVNSVGSSFLPTLFPSPYLIPAGYRLRWNFLNLTAAPNLVFFTLFGRKIYAPISQVAETLQRTAVPTPADSPTMLVPSPL
ncbi:MAG: hypothetical protein GZ088_09705 [Acidipila sp.]|nr:hypothetical protein [Acidipila sp.]